MSNYFHPDADYYRKVLGVEPPVATPHLTEDEIKQNMKPMLPGRWRAEGNQLIAETENGTHVQTIPTDQLLVGTDDKGMPIFKRIVL